jgi:hypothetical protein
MDNTTLRVNRIITHILSLIVKDRNSAVYFLTNPSPLPTTSFLGRTSTFLLNSFRSSGVIIFLAASVSGCLPGEVVLLPREGGRACVLTALPPAVGEVGVSGEDGPSVLLGAGKFSFLSTASTRRWKRRKRASARTSVDSRSIEPDSSLTAVYDVSNIRGKGVIR